MTTIFSQSYIHLTLWSHRNTHPSMLLCIHGGLSSQQGLLILRDPNQISLLTWHFHQPSLVPVSLGYEITLSLPSGWHFSHNHWLFTCLLLPLTCCNNCHYARSTYFWPAMSCVLCYAKPLNKYVCTEEETKVKDKCLLTSSEIEDHGATGTSNDSKVTAFCPISWRFRSFSLLCFWMKFVTEP